MTLADLQADNVAFAAAHSGEQITYLEGGVAPGKVIRAVVHRQARELVGDSSYETMHDGIRLTITSRASDGVAQINVGSDVVLVAARPGGTPEQMTVNAITASTAGSWQLEVA
jgi:hypothetical protein